MSRIKKKLRLAFYVSGGASRLLRLIEKNSPIIQDTILVANDNPPNSKLSKLLYEEKIQYLEINFSDLGLKAKEKNKYLSDLLLKKLKKFRVDYCFCFGRKLLIGDLLNQYKNKIINFHPSILPIFPGENSIDQAISKNAFLLGNTAHFIDKGVDTGPIIMQSIIHSKKSSKYEDVLCQQIVMIEQIHRWIIDKRLVISKNRVTISNANYSSKVFYPNIELK